MEPRGKAGWERGGPQKARIHRHHQEKAKITDQTTIFKAKFLMSCLLYIWRAHLEAFLGTMLKAYVGSPQGGIQQIPRPHSRAPESHSWVWGYMNLSFKLGPGRVWGPWSYPVPGAGRDPRIREVKKTTRGGWRGSPPGTTEGQWLTAKAAPLHTRAEGLSIPKEFFRLQKFTSPTHTWKES